MPMTDQLRDLHRLHRQTSDLRERLERGPKQIKAGERNVEVSEQKQNEVKEQFTKARMLSDEKQLQLKEREDRVEKVKVQLNACSSNKEYQALKEQIAADVQANSVLSDEILETLEKIDQLEIDVKAAQDHVAKTKNDLEQTRQRVADENAKLESELGRVTNELEQVEANLPSEFKTEYERSIKRKGEDGMAQLEGESCGGCYQILTPQTLNELSMSLPVFCKSCGRLLYMAE